MSEIGHQPCPMVSCGSSDAFSWNTNGFGKCHACDQGYPTKKETFSWAKERYQTGDNMALIETFTPKRIEASTDGRYLGMRGITSSTMEDFKVYTYEDRQEYVYPSGGIKVRRLDEKAFYAKNGFKGDELFGMNLFTAGCSKKVTITEGELDALSVAQMLKSSYINPVVSLPLLHPLRSCGTTAMTG